MCKHTKIRRGLVYDYCENCGAVRKISQLGKKEKWHVCNLCRLRGSK